MPSAPHYVRDGMSVTKMGGTYFLFAGVRLFAHGRAKRLVEHGDSLHPFDIIYSTITEIYRCA